MAPYALIATLVLVASLLVVTRARAAEPSIQVKTARTIVATWICQDHLGVPRTRAWSPWKPHSTGFRRAELARWQNRWRKCTYLLHERARQWNWQAWLPDKWRRIAVCETGLNWQHANSSYVSAFGISVASYDDDAAYMGVPGWPKKRVAGRLVFDLDRAPSPWHQWQAAVGHYKQHGGFSGWGCRGA